MTVVVVAGNELGLQDATLNAQGRQDLLGNVGLDNGSGLFINVATGNLVYTHQDSFLPSRGQDFDLIRTYNSRGTSSDPGEANDARWTLSTSITLKQRNNGGQTYYEVRYGDGAVFEYYLDQASGQYVTTDGEGAYEVLNLVYSKNGKSVEGYEVVRADQSTLRFDKQGNLTKWSDANGVYMEFFYKSNRLVQVKDDTGHTVNYNYAKGVLASITSESATGERNTLVEYRYSQGRLSEVIDREGHVTRYYYTNNGYLERIELPSEQDGETFEARSITFTYASVNTTGGQGDNTPLIASITDAKGKVTAFSYDFVLNSGKGKNNANFYAGGTTTVTDAKGNRLVYTYDDRGNITQVLDQDSNATSYTYDDQDNLLSIEDRRGNTTSFTYDGRGNVLSKTDNEGNTTTYTYTDFNKIASITEANQADAANPLSITFAYDDNFNLIKQTSALGDVTRYEYDGFGNLEREVAELYDADRNVIGEQETLYFYDQFGNNIGTETAVGGGEAAIITVSEYDIFGNRTKFTDGNGQATQFIYDNDNRLLQTIDPLKRITTFTYDAVGNLTTFTDAKGFQTVNVYDRNNNLLTSTELGDGTASRTVTRVYDVLGNVDSIKDAEGRVTTYRYNARSELVTITTAGVVNADGDDEGSYTTSYGYDKEGNRVTITDARSNATTFEYNENNQLEFETNAIGQRIQYAYDANTNLISVVAGVQLTDDLKRQQTHYEYDADNQLIAATDAEGNRTAYTYDAVGNLASVTDARGNALAESDAEPIQDLREELGFARLVGDLAEGDAEALRGYYTTRYEYDLANRLILEIQPEADEAGNPYTIEYRFDGNGNQVGVTDANGKTTTITFDEVNRKTVVLDANDIETRYSYDDNDNLTSVSIQDTNNPSDLSKTTYGYNGFNQLIEEVDALGNALAESDALLYQELRENLGFARLVGDLGQGDTEALRGDYTTRYTYDLVDNLTSLTDREGRVTRNTYDSQNRLIEEVTAAGTDDEATRRFFYDGNDNVVRERDALNRNTNYSYDEINRLTQRADADGYITALDYDTFNNLSEEVTAATTDVARTTKYVYDLNNRLTGVTDPRDNTMAYSYDAVGNRIEVRDARGNSTDFEYDALNRLIVARDPNSFVTTFAYDGVGNQIKITDTRGAITEMVYDPGNRLVKMTDGEGRVTEYAYDAQANQISMTTALGTADAQTTSYQYDAANNLRSITDAGDGASEGGVTEFGYDRVYNQTTVTDARGNTTTTTFDALNRQIAIEDAHNGVTTYTLDIVGNILAVENANNQVTSYTYNDNDQVITETDALGTVTRYEYHPDREVALIVRAEGQSETRETLYEYDVNGNVTREVNDRGDDKTFVYDENNNLIAKTDENGNQTLYLYDALNRVSAVIEGENGLTPEELTALIVQPEDTLTTYRALANPGTPSGNIAINVTEYAFDGNGNRTAIIDGNGYRTEFYFNAANEQAAVVDALGFMTTYEYDDNGNIIKEIRYATAVTSLPDRTDPDQAFALPSVANSPDDRSTRYEYDALNRVIAEFDANDVAETYSYDKVGNLKSVTDRNSNVTGYDYDALNRLVLVTDALDGKVATTYDALGNTLTRQDQLGRVVYYEYDALNRLTRESDAIADGGTDAAAYAAVFDDANGDLVFTGFSYDRIGNLTSQTDKNDNTTLYRYDTLNRQIEAENALGYITEYGYDAVGNLERITDANQAYRRDTEEGYVAKATLYAYDALNRLVSVTDEMDRTRTTDYDAVGNVISDTDIAGTTTKFGYDVTNQANRREVLDGELTSGSAVLTIHYNAFGEETRREDDTGVVESAIFNKLGQMESQTRDGVTVSYRYDLAGNIRFETRPGNPAAYDTFGAGDRVVEFVYDGLNRLERTIDSYGEDRHLNYDAVGNVLIATDERDHVLVREYDANNRVTREMDRDGFVTAFVYDDMGNETERRNYQTRFQSSMIDGLATIPDENTITGDLHLFKSSYTSLNQLESQVNGEGLLTEYRYDRVGNVTEIFQYAEGIKAIGDLTENFEVRTRYNAANEAVEQTDANGVVTRFVINSAGQLSQKIENSAALDGSGARTTQYTYDDQGRLKTETAANGLLTTYEYDSEGRIRREVRSGADVSDRITAFEYDEFGRKHAEIDPVGSRTEYGYDAAGNVNLITYAKGTTAEYQESFVYDLNDRLVLKTDAEGWQTKYEYDARGNKIATIQALGTLEQRMTTYSYDERDRLISITDPLENTTQYYYDQLGNQTAIVRANGTATLNTFDDMGRLLTNTNGSADVAVDALGTASITFTDNVTGGVSTVNTYDIRGNIETSTTGYANGTGAQLVTHYSYDALDQLISVTDADGFTTLFTYDAFGNKTTVENGVYLLEEGDAGYDANKASVARPQLTLFEYDAANNLTRTISGEGNVVVNHYDVLSNQREVTVGVRLTDALTISGKTISASDDVERRSSIRYEYDDAGRLLSKETDGGVRIDIKRDALGRQEEIRTLQSDGGTASEISTSDDVWITKISSFDNFGRLTSEEDARGFITEYEYDSAGNLTLVRRDKDAAGAGEIVERSVYDAMNRLDYTLDAEGNRTDYSYDAVGNLVEIIDAEGGIERRYYDAYNQLVAEVNPLGALIEYQRDAFGNALKVTQYATFLDAVEQGAPPLAIISDDDRAITQTFNGNGKRISENFTDGSSKVYTFDSAGLLIAQRSTAATDLDRVGRTSDLADRTLLWQWDDSGRLIRFVNVDGTEELYSYDSAGNKVSEISRVLAGDASIYGNGLANGRADDPKLTTFEYDLDNRLTRQVTGNNIQILRYDNAGNVIEKENGRGAIISSTYNLSNQIATLTNAVGSVIEYSYDGAGNLIELIDGMDNVSNYTYDLNGRLLDEIGPAFDVLEFSDAPVTENKRPTSTNTYDGLGRLLTRVDANGNTLTRWYDAAGQMTAEVDGTNTLRTYTYTAFGQLYETFTAREFLTSPLDGESSPPAAVSITSSAANWQFSVDGTIQNGPGNQPIAAIRYANSYDTAGNLVQTTYPSIDVTQLQGVGDSTAAASPTRQSVIEQSFFDAWGNLVESADRNGVRSYAYYDVLGRSVAAIDGAGFLVTTAYDSQGNIVEQIKFKDTFATASSSVPPDTSSVSADRKAVVTRFYTVEGYLEKELSGRIYSIDPSSSGANNDYAGAIDYLSSETRYTYDAAGNETSRTSAYGTPQAQTEFYYYDFADQRIAVIDATGALGTFTYNDNGKLVEQRRYAERVNGAAPSDDALTDTTVQSLANIGVSSSSTADLVTTFTYNALNLLATETKTVSTDHGGDRTTTYEYDAAGNLTRKVASGLTTLLNYDAAGRNIQSITPNGAYSFIEYNTFGFKTKVWTGGDPASSAPLPTPLSPSVSMGANGLISISWGVPEGELTSGLTSWVAWDSISHASVGGSGPSSAPGGQSGDLYPYGSAASSDNQNVTLSVANLVDSNGAPLAAGSSLYYRVVIEDEFGNSSWSEEQALVLPPTVLSASVRQTASNTFAIEASFSGASEGAEVIVYDASGNEESRWAFDNGVASVQVASPDTATIAFVMVAGGESYQTSPASIFLGGGATQQVPGWLQWDLPRTDEGPVGDGQWVLIDGERVSTASFRSNDTLQLEVPEGSDGKQYDIFYGNIFGSGLDSDAERSNTLTLRYNDGQTSEYRAGVTSGEDDDIETTWEKWWVSNNNGKVGADLSVAFSSEEINTIGDGTVLQVAIRNTNTGAFSLSGTTLSRDGSSNTFVGDQQLVLSENTQYDIKIFYTNADGKEVIVQWDRFTSASETPDEFETKVTRDGTTPPASENRTKSNYSSSESINTSLTVLASETGGTIEGSSAALTTLPGRVSGPVTLSDFTLDSLTTTGIGSSGQQNVGELTGNDLDLRPYYTMFEYNDLGYLTASNEGDGLWRTFGVDAMGSKVHTTLLGDDRSNSSGIESFKVFDERGLVRFIIGASGDSGRAVEEKAYDYERRVSHVYEAGNFTYTSYDSQGRTAVTYTNINGGTYLAGAKEFHYDDVGNVIGTRDALGHYTQNQYDLLGNRIRTEDAAGDVQVFFYDYTGENSNRLTDSYYVGSIESTREHYDYDIFGRRTAVTKVNVSTENNGDDAVARVQYNQAGELIQLTDAENRVTKYWYNVQGKQEWVQDANGKFFGKAYDEMGRLTKEYSFTSDPSNLAAAKSRAASGHSSTIITESIYDIYGNLRATISPEGDRTNRSYGDFGRIVSSDTTAFIYDNYGRRTQEYSGIDFSSIFGLDLFSGAIRIKNITREYNAAGQLTEINDLATATRTTYSYDLRGNRLTEKLYVTDDGSETLQRDVIYSYNANGELTRWADNAPDIFQTYSYFDDGNIASINSDGSTKEYTYDAANRVTSIGDVAITYNFLGARASEGGVSYKYDKTGWLKEAGGTTWSYDNVGNILTRDDGSTSEVNIYDYAYRVYQTTKTEPDGDDDGDDADVTLTTTTFDRDGKTLTTKADKTTFTYTYNSAGLVTKITGSGADSASGSSTSSYDENGRLSVVNRGTGDDDSASTLKTFVYDNEGRIITRATVGGDDAGVTYYLYGNGNPLGEYQSDGEASPTLNTGNYSVFQTISSGFGDDDNANPASSITQVTIQGGESLKSLAAQNYGSPDLWYLIADANGLKGTERLEAGTRLVIPNNANNAFQTAETNALYKEGDIVGSKLPNLTTPPPEEDECAKITAIILIVVVAIVAVVLTVVTVGAAAPAAAAALGFAAGGAAAIATGVVVGAVIGAAIAFAASAATQGILVGFGLQESFDWDAVLADTVAGAFGGAAAGLGAAVSAGRAISTTAKIVNVVGQIALESAGEAASQAIQNEGRVDAPWLVVAAGAGGALGGIGDIASRTSKAGAKLGFAAGETGIAASFGSTRGARTAADASAKLAVIDDVAAVAKKAGKGKWGVFKDAFRYQVAEIRGTTFTQTLAKTGKNGGALKIGDKAAEFTTDALGVNKKLVRTISPLKVLETGKFSGLSKVDYSTVARASSKADGLSILTKIKDGTLNFFREGASSAAAGLGKARDSAAAGLGKVRDSALNLFKGGTVGKGATQKLVKSFKNGQPVYEVVNRVGKSSLDKITDAAAAGLNNVRDGALNLIKGGTVGKGTTQKLVKSFKNGQPVYEVVNRLNQSGLSRFADAAAAGLKAFGKKVSTAADEFINPITEAQKVARAKKISIINDIAKVGVGLAAAYEEERMKAENPDFNYQASVFKTSGVGRRGGLRFATNFGKAGDSAKTIYRAYRNATNPSRKNERTTTFLSYTVLDFVTEKIANLKDKAGLNGSEAAGSESFNDIDARNTYADRHDRQHKYIPIRWFDVAAGATSTVFSPFAIDRAGTLETNLQSVRLVSGEVFKFDTQSIIAFAERSVGGVEGSGSTNPNLVT